MDTIYDDGLIALDEEALTIRRYRLPWGQKRIPYTKIVSVHRRPLTWIRGRARLFGSGDLVHWWNLDPLRPTKSEALELELHEHFVPTITPDDPATVYALLTERLGTPSGVSLD